MIKDILLVLEAEFAAASYALSFARLIDADITAVWPRLRPAAGDFVEAELRYDLLAGQEIESDQDAVEQQRQFQRKAREAGVRANVLGAAELQQRFLGDVYRLGRGHDLVIVGQSRTRQYARDGGRVGSLITSCGRPVLAIPFIQRDPPSFAHVVVAWDASASAARSVGDALPILKRAGSVEVVTVANAGQQDPSPSPDDIVAHLGRHAIAATSRTLPGGDTTASALLNYMADWGVTLMVTGSYGHTRLGEALLGGVTRTLLESMTVPMLISH